MNTPASSRVTLRSIDGATAKGCLFAFLGAAVCVVAVFVGFVYWTHSKLAAQTSVPIPITPVAEPEKVKSQIDSKSKQVVEAVKAGKEGTMTLSSDEFHTLVRDLMPEALRDSFRLTAVGDAVLVQLPMKGVQAAGFLPKEYGTLRWYVEKVQYTNLEARLQVGFDGGKWSLKVLEVTRPMQFSPAHLQGFIDEMKKSKAPSTVQLPIGGETVQLISLQVKDSTVEIRFQR